MLHVSTDTSGNIVSHAFYWRFSICDPWLLGTPQLDTSGITIAQIKDKVQGARLPTPYLLRAASFLSTEYIELLNRIAFEESNNYI